MEVKLYNTLTRKKEVLQPIQTGKIGLYTCGPTVYSRAHIGNFRTFVFEDVLKRVLQLVGYDVKHVMNITDVDDKTIKKVKEENKPLADITSKYTTEFMEDLATLKILPADHFPKATDHIQEMIHMIQTLVDKNIAYVTKDNSIFFSIGAYTEYGKLVNICLLYTSPSPRDS